MVENFLAAVRGSAAFELLALVGGIGFIVLLVALIAFTVEAWSKRK